MKGRRAEVDDVNGLVVEVLAAAGEKAPYNAHTVDLAHRIERGELARSRDNLDLLLGL
jgi:2-dehydropantoate 2-reductase